MTVMVTIYSHKLVYQSTLFGSEMSYLDGQKHAWFEIKQIYLQSSRPLLHGCWKLEVD